MTRWLAIALACALAPTIAAAEEWGTIKGEVVWAGGAIPPRAKVDVTKDKDHCLAKGPLLSDELLIDATTNGIRDVIIWLASIDKKKPLAIHPDLKAIPKEAIEIDQPCCQFVPRAVALRAGQTLIIKNSASVPHAAQVGGDPAINAGFNTTIQAGSRIELSGEKALRAEERPLSLSCSLHTWMKGRIGVFDHPYFAVTGADGKFEIKNVPAGEVIIKIKHERWLHQGGTSAGQKVTVPAAGTLDLGKIKVQ